jgi:hypothetical protein
MNEIEVNPGIVDKLYVRWRWPSDPPQNSIPYSKRFTESHFENWLWDNGFLVRRKNKKKCVYFFGDEKKLTLFLLKWT